MKSLRVLSLAGVFGVVLLRANASYAAAPPNDNFANSITLVGASGVSTGTTLSATYETGEPEHDPYGCGENSVWWKWTAPASGLFAFDLVGSTTEVVLAVYTGTTLTALQRQGYTRHYPSGQLGWLQINAAAGTTYRIAVAGLQHFGGGTVCVRYYPDILSGWLNQFVTTGRSSRVECGVDGSMLAYHEHAIYALQYRTNSLGYTRHDAAWQLAISNAVLRDRHGLVIASNAFLPGTDYRYASDLNKKTVLMIEQSTSNLSVFAVHKGALELVGQRTFATWFNASIDGNSIVVALDDNPHGLCALQVYDQKLKKLQWEVPAGTGMFYWARAHQVMNAIPNFRNGTVFRMAERGSRMYTDVTRKGKPLASHELPVTAGFSELRYLGCEQGTLLYWYGLQYTNSGISLLTTKGDLQLNNQSLPGAGTIWNGCGFNGKYFYATAIEGTNYTLGAYLTKKTVVLKGTLPQPNLWNPLFVVSQRVYVERVGAGGSIGFDTYDSALKKRRGGVAPATFNMYSYLGEGTFLRVMMGATEDTYTIEGAKGVIATHVVPHWP